MKDFVSLLVHPSLIGNNVFIVLGIAIVWFATDHKNRAEKFLRGAWAISLALIAIWIFQQEHHVRLASLVPTTDQPVAVSFKGTTRYVSETRAFLYHSGKWLLLGTAVVVIGIDRFLSRKRDEA